MVLLFLLPSVMVTMPTRAAFGGITSEKEAQDSPGSHACSTLGGAEREVLGVVNNSAPLSKEGPPGGEGAPRQVPNRGQQPGHQRVYAIDDENLYGNVMSLYGGYPFAGVFHGAAFFEDVDESPVDESPR